MALTAYIAATNRLLQNPVPVKNPLYTTADLTVYINEARQQVAGEAECIRALTSLSTVANQRGYAFSSFSGFVSGNTNLTGVASVLTVRQLSVQSGSALISLTQRPWPWFYRYYISSGVAAATGMPSIWSQHGRGTAGTFNVTPIPTSIESLFADVSCLPIDLADDSTAENIPAPWTEAVKYYAAYLAYLSSQRRDDATIMFNRYTEFVRRATQENTSTILPDYQPGGVGAQGASGRVTLTTAPAQKGQ